MKTRREIEKSFMEDLQNLLKKHNASIEICDYDDRNSPFMEVYIPSVHDKDGNCISEYVELDIGRIIEGE